jgi:predicted nucleic acid-binding protein
MLLVDTSVFIEFFKGSIIKETELLAEALRQQKNVALTGIIYQEVLQGIRKDKDFKDIKNILDDFVYLNTPEDIYLDSAQLFRKLRKKGVTVRKSADILIAQMAIHHNISLLQFDRDFKNIAKHSRLKLHSALTTK